MARRKRRKRSRERANPRPATGRARALGGRLRPVGRQLHAGRTSAMRAHAAAFLADVEARPDSPEAGIAHRVQGMTHYFAGEFVEAMRELERALALFEPGRDDDLAVRFPPDPGVASMIYLAFASWALGEVDRAVSFIERMRARIAGLSHAPTLALGASARGLFRVDARRPSARPDERLRTRSNRARSRSAPVPRVRRVSRRLGDRRRRRARRRARGHAPRRRKPAPAERRGVRRARQDRAWPRPRRARAIRSAPSRFSTKRWRPATARAIARSNASSTGRAANSCSSAIPPIPRPPKKPSRPPSPSRSDKALAAIELLASLVAREALPIDRSSRRGPRRPRARARRLFADAGNAGDRRGRGAAGGAGGNRGGQGARPRSGSG